MTTTLYRMFDASGRLLYVGITGKPFTRFSQHRNGNGRMWTDVARIEVEHFDSRTKAAMAERLAISGEYPAHNVSHNRAATAA